MTAQRRVRWGLTVLAAALLWTATAPRAAEPGYEGYLSAAEGLGIGGASVAAWGLGHFAKRTDSGHAALIGGPLPGERRLQRMLGGRYYPGKTNFLDNTFGSAVTPIIGAVALTVTDASWSRGGETKDVAQDLTLYVSGLLATKGITDLSKGLFGRPRPMVAMYPDDRMGYGRYSWQYRHHAFFSGHASSAFFSMAFLNKRIRETLRRESPDNYDDWNWVPSVVCYGWASFVGWTRMHAYKHYFSDVVVGALAGWLLAELFYSFDDVAPRPDNGAGAAGGIYFAWSFRL